MIYKAANRQAIDEQLYGIYICRFFNVNKRKVDEFLCTQIYMKGRVTSSQTNQERIQKTILVILLNFGMMPTPRIFQHHLKSIYRTYIKCRMKYVGNIEIRVHVYSLPQTRLMKIKLDVYYIQYRLILGDRF